jgi:hypothetical protein
MATTSKVLYRGAAATTNTLLYTVPASTTTVITNIIVANTASTSATFDLYLNDVFIANDVTIAANSITAIDLKQVLNAAQTIKGLASAVTVQFHISGVEIV